MGSLTRAAAVAAAWLTLSMPAALGADIIPDTGPERDALAAAIEARRIGIVTGGPGGTYIQLGSDLARLVQSATDEAIRVIVMEGRGSVGNLQDLVFLRYTDLALVQADVLDAIQSEDADDYAFLKERLRFVARFHPELIHVLARGGALGSASELDGKRVAIGAAGSGTQITAPIVFARLGIRPEYVPMHQDQALAELAGDSPTIDAMVYVAGRGSPLFTRVSAEMSQRIQDRGIYFVPFPDSAAGRVELHPRPHLQRRLSELHRAGVRRAGLVRARRSRRLQLGSAEGRHAARPPPAGQRLHRRVLRQSRAPERRARRLQRELVRDRPGEPGRRLDAVCRRRGVARAQCRGGHRHLRRRAVMATLRVALFLACLLAWPFGAAAAERGTRVFVVEDGRFTRGGAEQGLRGL